ncbi:hypothetical protein ACEPAH_5118 [Sanghuangporus vaninii]
MIMLILPKMRLRLTISAFARLSYLVIVLVVAFLLLISAVFLLSQAIRTSASRNWTGNIDAFVIGAAYVLVLVASLLLCLKRRLSVRLQLTRIPKGRIAVGKGDLPKAVHLFIEEELLRASTIAYSSLPKVESRDGWGSPGTKYEGVRFRTATLDLVAPIDAAARAVIPSMRPLSPHVPLARHLRHIAPLISADAHGETYFETFTDAVEKARYSSAEMTQPEFEAVIEAGNAIVHMWVFFIVSEQV